MAFPDAEVSKLAATYQVAVITLAAEVFRKVVELLFAMPTNPAKAAAFVRSNSAEVRRLVAEQRVKTREIAVAYMRLDRALQTGYTFPVPGVEDAPGVEKVDDLRRDFVGVVEKYAPSALESNVIPDRNPLDGVDDSTELLDADGDRFAPYSLDEFLGELLDFSGFEWEDDYDHRDEGLTSDVFVEEIDRLELYYDELEKSAEREAEDLLDRYHAEMARVRLKDDMEALREVEARYKALDERAEREAVNIASTADRIVQNGARHAVHVTGHLDGRVVGFLRKHEPREGHTYPCGFCGMMLSRSVFYKTERTAGGVRRVDEDGRPIHNPDEYHSGCHCTAVPVYGRSSLFESDDFALNREMYDLWKAYAVQANGSPTLSGFRSMLRKRRIEAEQDSVMN